MYSISKKKKIRYNPSQKKFPVIVSKDCGNSIEFTEVIKRYPGVITMLQPNLQPVAGYVAITRHFGWAFKQVFDVLGFPNCLVVEGILVLLVLSVVVKFLLRKKKKKMIYKLLLISTIILRRHWVY